MLADAIWDAADVAARAVPHRRPGRRRRRCDDGDRASWRTELGAVWVGDARDGFNGGGNYVRWVRDADDLARRAAFFQPRCDRVRVMPFLDGVPCSIHGFVLPDGTAALRPVEIATLRNPVDRSFVYGGLGTTWDPPAADRDEMRDAARRVGRHLQRAHGYRGAFGIDGVLTADGFRPTELNTRMSAGATHGRRGRPAVLHVAPGRARGRRRHRADARRRRGAGRADGRAPHRQGGRGRRGRHASAGDDSYPVAWDGTHVLAGGRARPATCFSVGDTPTGFFAKVDPCAAARARRAAGAGQRRPAGVHRPRVRLPLRRRSSRHPTSTEPEGAMARVVVVGGGYGGLASAARLAKLGHQVTLLERLPELGGALAPVTEDGFTWDAGPTSTLLPAVVRDLFRKTGRPLEDELELVPLDLVREHRFEDDSWVRLPGGSRAAQLAAFESARPRARPAVGRPRRLVRRRLGGAAARLLRGAVGPRGAAPRGGGPARQPRDAAPPAEEDVQGRAAAAGRRPPVRRRRPRPAQRAGVGRAGRPTSSSASAPGRSPAGWPCSAAALAARLETRGVDGAHRDRGPGRRGARRPGGRGGDRRRARSTPTSWCARSTRGGCPPWRRWSSGRCRRCRRSSPTSASAEPVPELPHEVVLHGDPMLVVRTGGIAPAGPRRLDGPRSRPAGRGHAQGAGPLRRRRPRQRRHPGRPLAARPGRAVGRLAARRAVAGPRHGAAPARPARPRSRGCTPPARTRRRAPGCRSWGCPPRWSRRWSDPPRPSTRSGRGHRERCGDGGLAGLEVDIWRRSRADGRRRRKPGRRARAVGDRDHVAQGAPGQLGEVLGAGRRVGERRLARLGERPSAVSLGDESRRGLDMQPVSDRGGSSPDEERPRRRGRRSGHGQGVARLEAGGPSPLVAGLRPRRSRSAGDGRVEVACAVHDHASRADSAPASASAHACRADARAATRTARRVGQRRGPSRGR